MKNDLEMRDILKNNLIDLRVEKGLTQTDVGLVVGKSKTAVASWEQGLYLPDPVTLYRLATYYNKTMDYLYQRKDDKS